MYRIAQGNTSHRTDVAEFVDLINRRESGQDGFFDSNRKIYVARAPGRLDVMGGIADYSGSLVLQMPIAEATFAAVQKNPEPGVSIVSLYAGFGQAFKYEIGVSELTQDYATVRQIFHDKTADHWAAYVCGVFSVLSREKHIDFNSGARILISSSVPIGKGVSSSAALEVSVMNAVCFTFDLWIEPRELAMLCQKVENEIVGAPCGVMDQIASNCGIENALTSLLCQPAEIRGTLDILDMMEFWGIDSGVRHAVAGSDYTSVRVAAFMGYRIIADLAGFAYKQSGNGRVKIQDDRWHGYLCNISAEEYGTFERDIPAEISGSEFLNRYGGTTDKVTTVQPHKSYAVKVATEHAVLENCRVHEFSDLLRSKPSVQQLDGMGELMFESHASYAACGLTEPGTDLLVDLVRERRSEGLFGARITGGGSGGTVAVLSSRYNEAVIQRIASQYENETGREPYIFHGSSPGSAVFGTVVLEHR